MDRAIKALRKNVEWRNRVRPQEAQCPACSREKNNHAMRIVGLTKEFKSVVYNCWATCKDRYDADETVHHMRRVLEDSAKITKKTFQNSPARQIREAMERGKMTFIFDFQGFGLRDASPQALTKFVNDCLQNYAERLEQMLFIDAPGLFKPCWNLLKAGLPQETVDKFQFCSSKDLRKNYSAILGEELTCWLEQEMQENRDKNAVKRKFYWEPVWPDGKPKYHLSLGCHSYVNSEYFVPLSGNQQCKGSYNFERYRR